MSEQGVLHGELVGDHITEGELDSIELSQVDDEPVICSGSLSHGDPTAGSEKFKIVVARFELQRVRMQPFEEGIVMACERPCRVGGFDSCVRRSLDQLSDVFRPVTELLA